MAIYHVDIADIDLGTGTVHRTFAQRTISEGDATANEYGVRLWRGGYPVALTGSTCEGFFIRPDGVTLVIEGVTTGNTAWVTLPAAAYAVEGNFSMSIRITGAGIVGTMRIVDGTVVRTTTDTIADPESAIPSLEELLAVIGDAEDAADVVDGLQITATQITGTRYKIAVTKS